jgi:hypothetical protein
VGDRGSARRLKTPRSIRGILAASAVLVNRNCHLIMLQFKVHYKRCSSQQRGGRRVLEFVVLENLYAECESILL